MMKCSSCGTEIESGAEAGGDSASCAAVRLKTDRNILLYAIFGSLTTLIAIFPFVFLILCLGF